MSTATQDIVGKLWNLCHVLRDDGITYHQYVTELTYLLFIKMAQETGTDHRIPEAYRWDNIADKDGTELLQHYRRALVDLADEDETDSLIVRTIYEGAATSIRKPKNLRKIVEEIDKTGSVPERKGSAICTRAFWKRTRRRRNRGRDNTSRLVPSLTR